MEQSESSAEPSAKVAEESTDPGTSVLEAPSEKPRFPQSTVLGLDSVEEMMRWRYGTVIGILGDVESGKTACLVSLYLLVSHGGLRGWSFADSRTLMGFEEISRGARRWSPDQSAKQMTVHTETADDRVPGFLHIRLRQAKTARTVDFLLPDLPGEWTQDLASKGEVERFTFFGSADVIWLVVDGRDLMNRETRHGAMHRIRLLMARLVEMLPEQLPRLILVPTRRDSGEIPEATISELISEARALKISLSVRPVAPFSDDGEIEPGHGLHELIAESTSATGERPDFWVPATRQDTDRAFLGFRILE